LEIKLTDEAMTDWFCLVCWMQDIHYQGMSLKEAPAPIGFH
jgi:hypothetical protein